MIASNQSAYTLSVTAREAWPIRYATSVIGRATAEIVREAKLWRRAFTFPVRRIFATFLSFGASAKDFTLGCGGHSLDTDSLFPKNRPRIFTVPDPGVWRGRFVHQSKFSRMVVRSQDCW